ncbi:MAG TPA: DUF4266 domain-containing protein [Verrucomicrobiae bacterium]|nr:DUF4266 domain-containing protein [Verrucomicrobiae bacterium]
MRLPAAVTLVATCLLAGCGTPPKAWERNPLAEPTMAFEPDPLLAGYRNHLHASKEQAAGSGGAGSGGCGCSN